MLLLLSDDALNPRSLFAAGEQGFWYDLSDFSTLFQDAAGTTPVTAVGQSVGRINDKSGRGNHATQSTAASRPTVEARVNLLTKTEDFTDAVWVKALLGTGSAPIVTQNYAQAPDGSMTAVRVQLNQGAGTTLSDVSSLHQTIAYLPGIHTNRVYVKATSSGEIGKKVLHRGAASSAYTSTTLDGTWQEVTWAETASGGAIATSIVVLRGASGGNANAVDVLIWHPQVQTGTSATSYQRVNTATDYVDVGAARYELLDKIDDHFTVAAGGAGTTGILLAIGVMVPAAGTARTIWSDQGTNTGYRLSIDATNKVTFSGGTGAAFTTLTSAGALTAGTKYILMAWHDGTNLNLSINNVAETPVALGTVTAGTTTFTVGKDNGSATGYWGDRLYQMVYRKNDTSNASQRAQLFQYIRAKMQGL